MSIPGRRSGVVAVVRDGFVATEAPAFQVSIVGALEPRERGGHPIGAELRFERGAEGRVLVVWRNRSVGFVPSSHREDLAAQIAAAGKATVRADGRVYRDGALWRVWVGPMPASGFPAIEAGYDELRPPETTLFGFALRRSDGAG